jgi:predicted transcriptional regulator
MTRSASARTLAEQGLPRSEISRKLGITREAVRQAIGRKRPRPGRPPGDKVRVVLRLPRTVYDRARELQKAAPASMHKVLVDVIAKQLLPEGEWKAYKSQDSATRARKKRKEA